MFRVFWDRTFNNSETLKRTKDSIEQMKRELTNRSKHGRYWWRQDDLKGLILSLRLEHLQIYKHQKIAMKYLQQIEDMCKEQEPK